VLILFPSDNHFRVSAHRAFGGHAQEKSTRTEATRQIILKNDGDAPSSCRSDLTTNPAAAVRGPKHVVKTGKTPVLEADAWRKLLKSIRTETLRDLRDRALIATLTYSFARITGALKMKLEDLRPRGPGWSVRLGGKHHTMPCHHALAEALHAYIDAAGIADDRKGWLFRTARGHNGKVLSKNPMTQSDAWRMIRRRAAAAGIAEAIGCHTFRATGITAYLSNDGALERRKWRRTRAHGQPSSTTERKSVLPRMRSSEFGCKSQKLA